MTYTEAWQKVVFAMDDAADNEWPIEKFHEPAHELLKELGFNRAGHNPDTPALPRARKSTMTVADYAKRGQGPPDEAFRATVEALREGRKRDTPAPRIPDTNDD